MIFNNKLKFIKYKLKFNQGYKKIINKNHWKILNINQSNLIFHLKLNSFQDQFSVSNFTLFSIVLDSLNILFAFFMSNDSKWGL